MREINIGLGELAVSRDPDDILVAYGLGSCIGLVMTNSALGICGLLHAVLPRPADGLGPGATNSPKYVEDGIEGLISGMVKEGAKKNKLVVRMVGGANMLMSTGLTKAFDIGTRNIEAAQATLKRLGLPIAVAEVGGHLGRTVRVYVANSRVTVRVIGQKEHDV